MSLTSLPNEILTKIIRSISDLHGPTSQERQTLLHLCQCSRHLYSITEPILYSAWKEKDSTSLLQFLTKILKAPVLARSVVCFEAADKRWRASHNAIQFPSYIDDDVSKAVLSFLVRKQMKRVCDRISSEDEEARGVEWLEAIKAGNWDAVVTFALVSLPAVRHLKLSVHGLLGLESALFRSHPVGIICKPGRYCWMEWAFQRAETLQRSHDGQNLTHGAMQDLKTVELVFSTITTRGENIAFSQLLFFLTLPSVWSFHVTCLFDLVWDIQTPISLHNVKALRLRNCPSSKGKLDRLLGSLSALETLHVEDDIYSRLSFYIQHLQHSLKELIVINSYGPYALVEASYRRSAYGNFEKLEKMGIVAPHLSGWVPDQITHRDTYHMQESQLGPFSEVIPKSVKNLVLSCCGRRILEKMGELLDSTWIGESKLEYLELNCYVIYKPWIERSRKMWEKSCERAGVKLEIGWNLSR